MKNIDVNYVFAHIRNKKKSVMAEEPGKSTPSGPQMYVELNSEQPKITL
jgi:hypothetical protein